MRRVLPTTIHWLFVAVWLLGARDAQAATCTWPDWDDFKQTVLSVDGRVIDASTPQQATVSEGQAYALFFALVANDRPTFDRVLDWTQNNLAQGDLTTHLPAWIWGRRQPPTAASSTPAVPDDQQPWGVIDTNSASDADVWIAYTLLEAGRLWHARQYTALGTVMTRLIAAKETANLPGLGRTLLPGPAGFSTDAQTWRLNPSYVPLQVMRRLARVSPSSATWKALLESSARLVTQTAPHGFSPDWVQYRSGDGFRADDVSKAAGSYNAIRVYLWAGMLEPADPWRARVLPVFQPMADAVARLGYPPERVDTQTGMPEASAGYAGFSAAVAPYLAALGRHDLAAAQVQRARTMTKESPPGYYARVLILFGLGYLDGLFRFDAQGAVAPAWTATCPAPR